MKVVRRLFQEILFGLQLLIEMASYTQVMKFYFGRKKFVKTTVCNLQNRIQIDFRNSKKKLKQI